MVLVYMMKRIMQGHLGYGIYLLMFKEVFKSVSH